MKATLKRLALLPLFCGLLLTSACGNDDNGNQYPEPPDLSERLLPSKIFDTWECEDYSDSWGWEFSWDNQNRITEVRTFVDGYSFHEFFVEITYNLDGTISSLIFLEDDEEIRRMDFSYSGDTITAVLEYYAYTMTSQFIVNSRGQMVKLWGSNDDGHSWAVDFTYNANGNLIQMVETGPWGEETTNFEYSPTVRTVFRNSATPEWFLFVSETFDYDFITIFSKHGFMPTRVWGWREFNITYTEVNGWVQTATFREEQIGTSPATKSLSNSNRLLRQNNNRLQSDRPRRTPTPKNNGDNDYWEVIWHFEYVNAR